MRLRGASLRSRDSTRRPAAGAPWQTHDTCSGRPVRESRKSSGPRVVKDRLVAKRPAPSTLSMTHLRSFHVVEVAMPGRTLLLGGKSRRGPPRAEEIERIGRLAVVALEDGEMSYRVVEGW